MINPKRNTGVLQGRGARCVAPDDGRGGGDSGPCTATAASACGEMPIRAGCLGVGVQPWRGGGLSGRSVVSLQLRPRCSATSRDATCGELRGGGVWWHGVWRRGGSVAPGWLSCLWFRFCLAVRVQFGVGML